MSKKIRFQSLPVNKIVTWVLLLFIVVGAGVFRFYIYGDLNTSIGTVDTPVFIESSKEPMDGRFLSSGRPPTLPLIYKLLEPYKGYNLIAISKPSTSDPIKDVQLQPGFDRIVWVQTILSILGWSVLAIVVFYRLQNIIIKYLAVILILIFAYCPQLAEWDRILLSESLSFSLFALLLALTIEMIFRMDKENFYHSCWTYIISIAWLIIFVCWVFTRDTNVYFIIVTVILIACSIVFPCVRKKIPLMIIIIFAILLSGIFYIQQITMRLSNRWILPFLTNVSVNILPYDDRVNYFESMGMPVSDELMLLSNNMGGESEFYKNNDFMNWVSQHGTTAYTNFLLEYPLWASIKLYSDLELLFSENLQPWFTGPPENHPSWMIKLGDMFHPKTSAVILLDIVLTLIIFTISLRTKDVVMLKWVWVLVWLLMGEFILLFISYHGDARSTIRHTLVATMPLRLSVWLLVMVIFDFAWSLTRSNREISGFHRSNQ